MESEDIFSAADNIVSSYGSYLNLSANENVMSRTARHYLSTIVSDRYYFETTHKGYSDYPEFVAPGNTNFDTLADETRRIFGRMLGTSHVNLSPLSGIHAMMMILLSFTEPGEVVASLSPGDHGHFSTQTIVGRIARKSVFLPSTQDGNIDIRSLRAFTKEHSPRMIYIDAMSYQHPFNIRLIREVVDESTIIVFDASHTLGLIAGDAFPNPFDSGADIVCGNTHKTFPGPHRGIIFLKSKKLEEILDKNGSHLYSTVHGGTLLALAITVAEMNMYIKEYASHIVSNAHALQSSLKQYNLISPDIPLTENHQVHILMPNRETAIKFMKTLREQHIATHLCYGRSEGFFIRLGTQEITRRGMGKPEMSQIANVISKISKGNDCRSEIMKLNDNYKTIKYSFDEVRNYDEKY